MATRTLLSGGTRYLDNAYDYVGDVAPSDGDSVYRPNGVHLVIRQNTPNLLSIDSEESATADSGGVSVNENIECKVQAGINQRSGGFGNQAPFFKVYQGAILNHTGTGNDYFKLGYHLSDGEFTSYATQANPVTIKHTGASGSFSFQNGDNFFWSTMVLKGSWVNFENIAFTTCRSVEDADHYTWDGDCGQVTFYLTDDKPFRANYFAHKNATSSITLSGNVTDVSLKYLRNSVFRCRPQMDCPSFELRNCKILEFADGTHTDHGTLINCVYPRDSIYSGKYIDDNFGWADGSGNHHFIMIGNATRRLKGNVFEAITPEGFDSGNAIMTIQSYGDEDVTIDIMGNFIATNSTDAQSSGWLLTFEAGHSNGNFRILNNTITGGGVEITNADPLAAGNIIKYANNIIYSSQSNRAHFINLNIAPDDWITEAHHNATFGQIASDKYNRTGNEAVFANTPGTGDITTDPQFVDPTRKLARWAESVLGVTEGNDDDKRAHALLAFGAMCDPSSTYYNVDAVPENYINWYKAGWVPTNSDYLNGDQTEALTYFGAMEPQTGVTASGAAVAPASVVSCAIVKVVHIASGAAVSAEPVSACELTKVVHTASGAAVASLGAVAAALQYLGHFASGAAVAPNPRVRGGEKISGRNQSGNKKLAIWRTP